MCSVCVCVGVCVSTMLMCSVCVCVGVCVCVCVMCNCPYTLLVSSMSILVTFYFRVTFKLTFKCSPIYFLYFLYLGPGSELADITLVVFVVFAPGGVSCLDRGVYFCRLYTVCVCICLVMFPLLSGAE